MSWRPPGYALVVRLIAALTTASGLVEQKRLKSRLDNVLAEREAKPTRYSCRNTVSQQKRRRAARRVKGGATW